MPFLEDGTPIDIILNPLGVPGRMNIGQVLEAHLGWAAKLLGFRAITPVFDGANETEIEAELARAWMIDRAWKEISDASWKWINEERDFAPENIEDDAEVRLLYLEDRLRGRDYDIYRLAHDEIYARRTVLRVWLEQEGFDPDLILDFGNVPAGAPHVRETDQNAIDAGLKLWLSRKDEVVTTDESEAIREQAENYTRKTGDPMPIFGKQILRDGKTGIPYDNAVTIGVMMMLKLHHLVEDKVHARSTGPYSLVTQQPLGGKAQFGGQRFGEMEVWALEAYGAAYTLQEMLTVKSERCSGPGECL